VLANSAARTRSLHRTIVTSVFRTENRHTAVTAVL